MRRTNMILAALLAVGTATFIFALCRLKRPEEPPLYIRPEGGEREGEFELFIGS